MGYIIDFICSKNMKMGDVYLPIVTKITATKEVCYHTITRHLIQFLSHLIFRRHILIMSHWTLP